MKTPTKTLRDVRAKLQSLRGEDLRRIGAATGMSYDSVLRIRDATVDPPDSKVQQLAEWFRIARAR